MTQEKKPARVASTKKTTAKKALEMARPETAAMQAAPAVQKAAAKALGRTKTKAKPLQVSLEDIIRLRAYEIYLQRGATPGNPHEDWNVAEREVRAHFGQGADA